MRICLLLLSFIISYSLFAQTAILAGAERTEIYFPLLKGKRVALMTNQTAVIGDEHLLDFLLRQGIDVVGVFSPEHGFRGTSDAGESVVNSTDKKTATPIWSLYNGKSGKPSVAKMRAFDVLLFDIQDVGLRFYTYYISMAKMMDACADFNKKIIIADRPNPNGFYVDGPILDMKHKSGVGWLPIPVVHGMTLGELALMIRGERWLSSKHPCDLTVIPCEGYTHQSLYELPIPPSPNLPNMQSIYLYPSVCLFEGTILSLGRGTSFPFEVYGHPNFKDRQFSFTPQSIPGAKNPPLLNKKCFGRDLRALSPEQIRSNGFDLSYIIDAYHNMKGRRPFFTSFFEKLVGVDYIRKDIIQGKSASEIRTKWKIDVEVFKKKRKKYLLYDE